MKNTYSKAIPIIVLFFLINAITFIFKDFLYSQGFGIKILLFANLLLFGLSLAGFFIQIRGLRSVNANAFVRSVYSSLLIKIFIVIIVLTIYVFINKGHVNKPSLFTSMALYIVYTFLEVKQLMKISGRKGNA